MALPLQVIADISQVKIHTVLDLRDTPNGKGSSCSFQVIINQYDHTLVVESILYHQTEVPKLRRPLLVDPEHSIPRTAEVLFSRDASGRRALVFGAFAEDALYYNTFVEIHIQRVVPQGDRILVDTEQFFTPFFWPSFLHPLVWYNHILISTKDNPAGGKLITRLDNHIIVLEPFLRYNLGPLSWAYERMRIVNGKVFGYAGRSLHRILEWYHSNQVADRVAAHVPNVNGFLTSPSKMAN
ncbi:hypothetical protein COCSUDRAFT_41066 [Coccomyxa subellipsoidea C-169]|uniref:Uncharacterized protein n=1 Tax=Coccomyxa subellipsoidea (strain C-169) TaxID=574566 RepID=I0Z290_COCSC|nr:hypothetical protein COCSUDRAFT_41066 [Coccomyxa subellipsoidea C-169]EIE24759.1 hypothetical protein COCSUDRAFT_41066 [Coccomyxa subellipsoidea C-169]|eukprot:XP_005649303.1 hypothetical protein COCSUDRAFT_41066 [Coccomyxa subellipsoidea C-169]